MIKLLKPGKKREKQYYKTTCPYCESELAFEQEQIWVDDAKHEIGRIGCPVCRMKVYLDIGVPIQKMTDITSSEFMSAHSDMSKSGLQMLKAEKERADG